MIKPLYIRLRVNLPALFARDCRLSRIAPVDIRPPARHERAALAHRAPRFASALLEILVYAPILKRRCATHHRHPTEAQLTLEGK